MKLDFLKRNAPGWCLVDCVRMQRFEVSEFPCAVGPAGHCHVSRTQDGSVILDRTSPEAAVLLNGIPLEEARLLEEGIDYSLKVNGNFYLLRGDKELDRWIGGLNFHRWILQDINSGETIGAVPFAEIPGFAAQNRINGYEVITTVEGARQAFYLKDVVPQITPVAPEASAEEMVRPSAPSSGDFGAESEDPFGNDGVQINTVSGEFTCPHCWQHFDRGDVMWIAKHPSLRDPDLGEDYSLRFFPTSFDELGRAVDGMGVRCSDMACPNCKSKLPPQFLDLETYIISIVGAPSAGKSYYLTSMINQLEEALPRHFGLAFKDSDASGNAIVSDMRAKLFSDSTNPAEIALDKTVPGGEMFRSWERDGRRVKLPKPFTYLVSPFSADTDGSRTLHLVFYDNAGEQFEPAERAEGSDSSDVDSTQHLASSAAILFLYDPASNVRFRKMLRGKDDPQLTDEKFLKLNRQDNIIAEMRNRIMSELNVDANERISTPLLMLIGKYDLWAGLLPEPIREPLPGGGIDLEAIASNSNLIRNFLLQTSPGVVANAESISSEVVYFPVSPIGHSPRKFLPPGETLERIGPVPGLVNPLYPETPVLYILSRLHPELFPSVRR